MVIVEVIYKDYLYIKEDIMKKDKKQDEKVTSKKEPKVGEAVTVTLNCLHLKPKILKPGDK